MSDLVLKFPEDLGRDDKDRRYVILKIVNTHSKLKEFRQKMSETLDYKRNKRKEEEDIQENTNTDEEPDKEEQGQFKSQMDNLGQAQMMQAVQQNAAYNLAEGAVIDIRNSYDVQRKNKDWINNQTQLQIGLPYPSSFSESQGQEWSKTRSIRGELQKDIEGIKLGSFFKKGVKSKLGVSIGQSIASFQESSGIRKPMVNPNYFQDYGGPEMREFQFEWVLTPNSRKEADDIQRIIYNLKKFQSPQEYGHGNILMQPFSFTLEFQNSNINSLQRLDLLVCKNITINYGEKTKLFPDGTPKEITLSMQFQERKTLTQSDYPG